MVMSRDRLEIGIAYLMLSFTASHYTGYLGCEPQKAMSKPRIRDTEIG